MFSNWKWTETSFSQISTSSLCLQHAQMPRCRDLAIFVPTTTMTMMTTDIQTDYFTCTRGNKTYGLLKNVRTHTYTHVCAHTHMHASMRTHTHTHTNTHTHTHTGTCILVELIYYINAHHLESWIWATWQIIDHQITNVTVTRGPS